MQLLVVGMHRTGTSALTRVLSLCGAYVGEDTSMTTPNPNNPRGFWERRDVRRLNDLLLHGIGGAWDRVSMVGTREPDGGTLAEFHHGAAAVIEELEQHRPWVVKDPRLCVTLPWWHPHLDTPLCVFTHRNPLEIARSLHARNGFPLAFGIALWERYMQLALEATSGLPRMVLAYADLLRQPVEAAARVLDAAKQLGMTGLDTPDASALTSFIDPALHRQSASDDELQHALTPEQHSLHASLCDGTAVAAGFVHRPGASSQDALLRFERELRSRKKRAPRSAESPTSLETSGDSDDVTG